MPEEQLKENVDFYWDESGRMVLTKEYLLKEDLAAKTAVAIARMDL